MNTAKFVKETRKILGLTQQQLSEKIQKKRHNIALYETGSNIPPGDVMLKLVILRFPELCISELHINQNESKSKSFCKTNDDELAA